MAKEKTARDLALEVLLRVEKTKSYANLILSPALANSSSVRDKALATELVHGTMRTLALGLGLTRAKQHTAGRTGSAGTNDIAPGSISIAVHPYTSSCCVLRSGEPGETQ